MFTKRRREIAAKYEKCINNPAIRKLASPEEPAAHVYHLYVVTCEQRDALQEHLERNQVQTLIHYPVAVHHQEPFRAIKVDPAGLTATEQHAATCLSLPCHPQMTDADVDHVVSTINSFSR
jgi:dTDP-4-amino-4,6-dideoxygalactose transaminase